MMEQQGSAAVAIADVMAVLQAGNMQHAAALSDALIVRLATTGAPAHDVADAYHLRGMARRELGRFSEALEDMRYAAELDAGNAMLWLHIGQIEQRMGELVSALDSFRRATELNPKLEEAWFRLVQAAQAQHDWPLAYQACEHLLALPSVNPPIEAQARTTLGMAMRHLDQLPASLVQFQRALELAPDLLDARLNLAESYRLLGQSERAEAEIQHCLQSHPQVADVYLALSEVVVEQDASAALRALHRAVELEPSYRLRFARRVHRLERQLCEWTAFDASVSTTIQAAHEVEEELGDLFITLSVPGFDRALQRQRADRWAAQLKYESGTSASPLEHVKPTQGERLRIGYLSADFHAHPTAWLMAEVFELHERSRFEIFAYSLGKDDGSPMRQRLVQAFDVFHNLRGKSLAQINTQIRADGIDILVDLKGYTEHARPEIIALRPAPIQVNYLGYPGTLGGDYWDYIIADDVVLPEAHQADYSEKPVYMPWSYQCNDRQRAVAEVPTRTMAGLPEQGVVLCCFNTSYKLTPAFFALWCEVLREVPGSVLWVLDGGDAVRENLTQFAQDQGVDAKRLVFAPKLPHAQHLARLSLADLFLDTLPYNAHTTASDALWVGVPVVTCLGDTFAGRVAASLLRAVGLGELVADTPATYQAQLVRLAGDPQELARLREHLLRERLRCPLFESESFTHDLEDAYQQMWSRYQAGLAPEVLRVSRSTTPVPDVTETMPSTRLRPWYRRWLGLL